MGHQKKLSAEEFANILKASRFDVGDTVTILEPHPNAGVTGIISWSGLSSLRNELVFAVKWGRAGIQCRPQELEKVDE